MPKVCVLISGCGFLDGAEVHESVITLLALSRAGADYSVAAPHKKQMHVVNHHTGNVEEAESRMVHFEAARIARGAVSDPSQINVDDFDALFLPGGFGAAKNLSNFALEGSNGHIDPDVGALIRRFHDAKKPIGAVCIAPAILALALNKGTLTIGEDEGTAAAINTLGGTHQNCPVTEHVVDTENKLVTAPAYMCDASIADVASGIEKAVQATLAMC
ncbi:MAG: isoprenoid biosynthesis glyoxalase ElbB [Myxococcota bacterium]|nr:isoprenoid biosynthesis glyoxalase ElbB [Myxococcota bacterium]